MKYMHSATSFRNGLFLYKKESFFLFLQCAREREREIYSPQANNQCYKQNELMWQAAREEIPILLVAYANTNVHRVPYKRNRIYILFVENKPVRIN